MHRRIYTLFFILCSFFIEVRGQLTSSNFAAPGAEYSYKLVTQESDLYTISDTVINSSGDNVVWDFSSVTVDQDEIFSAEIVDPTVSPGYSSMTNANYCILEHFPTSDRYSYYNLTDTEYSRVGSYRDGVINTFSNPQTELIFPLSAGTINEDTYQSLLSILEFQINIECYASGNLILPNGIVYENVYLVETQVGGIPPTTLVFWYNEYGIPVAIFNPGDFITGEGMNFQYAHDLFVGTNDIANDLNLNYNNPVEDFLYLNMDQSLSENLSYNLFNGYGQIVKSGLFYAYDLEGNIEIDMQDLSSGVYLLNFQGVHSYKIIKN